MCWWNFKIFYNSNVRIYSFFVCSSAPTRKCERRRKNKKRERDEDFSESRRKRADTRFATNKGTESSGEQLRVRASHGWKCTAKDRTFSRSTHTHTRACAACCAGYLRPSGLLKVRTRLLPWKRLVGTERTTGRPCAESRYCWGFLTLETEWYHYPLPFDEYSSLDRNFD